MENQSIWERGGICEKLRGLEGNKAAVKMYYVGKK